MRALPTMLVLALLLPGAWADHAYSHRYVFEGRLLGADGLPLPGREVEFFSERDDFLAPCREGAQESITDEMGDFRFCFHHHELEAGARAGVRSGNASLVRALDVAFRRTVVVLEEPNETGIAPAGWTESYRVSGRAWRAGVHEVEGVPVYGDVVIGLPVNLTIRDARGGESVYRTTTDAFGDFDLVFQTEEAPDEIEIAVEAQGRAQPARLDPRSHRTYVPVYLAPLPGDEPAPVQAAPEVPPAPGASTPRVNTTLLVALALALVAAILLSRRKGR